MNKDARRRRGGRRSVRVGNEEKKDTRVNFLREYMEDVYRGSKLLWKVKI
jgi:hypothetical protein